jgi:putative hydrolase of the HAD superfamily
MHWIVFDYGEVISRRPASLTALAELLGVGAEPFEAAYWQFRDKYDRSLSDLDYWRAISSAAGSDAAVDEALSARLTAADIAGWSSTDPETIALLAELAADGRNLALLSNAPSSYGPVFRSREWARPFGHVLVSGEIGVAKPDAAVWQALAYRLGAEPADCLFFDDKKVNVDAATEAGIQGALWSSAAEARVRIKEFLAERGAA